MLGCAGFEHPAGQRFVARTGCYYYYSTATANCRGFLGLEAKHSKAGPDTEMLGETKRLYILQDVFRARRVCTVRSWANPAASNAAACVVPQTVGSGQQLELLETD